MFFSLDGGDGAGKTTQLPSFCDWLRSRGLDVAVCRDPGSTRLGEAVRRILLEAQDFPIARRSEMLLYMAARAQLTEEIIRPALAAGKTVVSDRYLLANVVYQGHAGGLDPELLWQVGLIATGGLLPDLTIVLDLPVEKAADRRTRPWDRMEQQGREFHERVRRGFLDEAARQPDRIVVVSADGSVEEVQQAIRRAASRWLDERPQRR